MKIEQVKERINRASFGLGKLRGRCLHFIVLAITGLLLQFFPDQGRAGVYFWDPQGTAGPSDGSGNWDDTTVSNWLNSSSGMLTIYTNNAIAGPISTNVVIGAGVPGSYNITNINPVTATTLTFSNAGTYTISGNLLAINKTAGPVPVLVSLPNTTNTIATTGGLGLQFNQGNDISNAPNSMLTLASGFTENGGNPRFEGINQANTVVNLAGGTFTDSTANGPTFQVSGITMNITNAILNAVSRFDLSRNAVQSAAQSAATVNVYNGGQLNANSQRGNNGGNHLQISRGGAAILNVYSGGIASSFISTAAQVNSGAANGGNIRISPDATGEAGTLNVLGGTVLVGVGASGAVGTYSPALTSLTFFDGNPTVNAASEAVFNMTSGSLTAYNILFGTPGSVLTVNPTNGINISGGTLYLGALNINYPAGGLGTQFFFNLSGGTISAVQNWLSACPAPINLTNVNGKVTFQAADINGTAFNMAFSGPLTGQGGFIKTGGGVLTLSGANNYTGATVVSNGTLVVNTLNLPVAGALTLEGASVASGLPTNSVVVANRGQSWTLNGALTYDTGTPTADFSYGTAIPSGTTPAIQVNGNLNYTVTPQMSVEGSQIPVGVIPLIKYTGTLSGTPPTTVTLSNIYSGYISNDLANKAIDLVVTSSPVQLPLTWRVGGGAWDTASLNWTANGAAAAYVDGSSVQFDDSASGPFPITVTNLITCHPTNITVTAANSYTITGPGVIAGAESLNKSGTGALTLTGTNTYSGGTTVSAGGGTLNINYGGDGVLNSAIGTGPLTLNGGAIDNTSGQAINLLTPITNNWNGNFTFVGTGSLDLGTAPVTLGANVIMTGISNNLEVDGVIGDNGTGYSLDKEGAGTLTLSNNNTFTGGVKVGSGRLDINSDGAVGTGPLTLIPGGTIDNTSGSSLRLNTAPTLIHFSGFTFLGTTNLDLGAGQVNVQNGTLAVSNSTLTLEGFLSGASTMITKTGPGALTLAGSVNNGSVNYTINGGTVNLNNTSPSSAISAGQPVTVNANGTLAILNPTGFQLTGTSLTLNGGLVEWNGDNESLNGVTFNSGILRDSNPTTSASLTVPATSFFRLGGTNDFDITNGASFSLNATVAGTAATNIVLLKTGLGTLTLTTNTTYAGNTTVSNGILSLTYATLATNSTVTIASGATLDLNFTNSANTTNTIAALIVNGVTQPVGIYNSNNLASITSGGSLSVVPPVTINPLAGTIQVGFSNGVLNLGWPTNAGWILQAQTNSLAVGLGTNWVAVPGSTLVTNLSVTNSPANGAVFYRMMHP